VDQAARVHLHALPFGRFHPPRRQFPHDRQFFGKTLAPAGVPLCEQVLEKLRIFGPVAKIAATAQQHSLLHGSLKAVVALLGIPVLVGLAGLVCCGFTP